MYERLMDIFNDVGTPRILLVGDFMIDHYVFGDTDRISPEAPVMVMNVTERQVRPGGAGSVAADLAILGAEVACAGIVGRDANGEQLRSLLQATGSVNMEGVLAVEGRPTTSKQRIIGLAQHRHRQQLMRIDEECSLDISEEIRSQLLKHIHKLLTWCDVVCLEDYNKGVLCPAFCREVIRLANQQGKKTIIDPARISDYSRYAGCWAIKPNRRELSLATGIEVNGEESWRMAAEKLARDWNISNVIVTLDKQGSYLYQQAAGEGSGELIPTRARSVYDVTGAGDMVLAMLGYLVGGHYRQAAFPALKEIVCLGNVAGGLEVERFGSVGISREEIIAELSQQRRAKAGKLRSVEALLGELQWHRQQKLKIVFTNGCFDILHPGHINLLNFAKEQGDILVVAINSDRSVSSLKGPTRPIVKEHDRAALLSALEAVDYIVIFDTPDPLHLIQKVSPDVLVKGSDWTGAVVGQEWVEQHGGVVQLMPLFAGRSTTNIIEKVIQQHTNQTKGADQAL